ncbi:hypothetical protein [Methylomonas sp. ZR1]|uniref:hypothetical protein n=1 Tax=Methylomonas sp. ZR1 TaxID=1797072 RepID=UPI00149328D0|nr:hypothetical protein [Methylomonas sp. ZR1]NOV29165.1 hypothetical protein [Methylomonas sp. ZR1]
MTTQVTIRAHLSDEKEVRVTVKENGEVIEQFALQHGESADRYVYESREISVSEVIKGQE